MHIWKIVACRAWFAVPLRPCHARYGFYINMKWKVA